MQRAIHMFSIWGVCHAGSSKEVNLSSSRPMKRRTSGICSSSSRRSTCQATARAPCGGAQVRIVEVAPQTELGRELGQLVCAQRGRWSAARSCTNRPMPCCSASNSEKRRRTSQCGTRALPQHADAVLRELATAPQP